MYVQGRRHCGQSGYGAGKRNPFRYRGYVCDEETGLYALRSRYYDPAVGRFVNADAISADASDLFAHNAYCMNAAAQ